METPIYIHLKPGDPPPRLEGVSPFKAVVVANSEVMPEGQAHVSDWLVRSGCRYMMAWGRMCSDWHSSVDVANLAKFNCGEIPEDDFVMTTSHENESLQEAFWFSERCAMHPSLELERTYIGTYCAGKQSDRATHNLSYRSSGIRLAPCNIYQQE
jgi:hypothetical protein